LSDLVGHDVLTATVVQHQQNVTRIEELKRITQQNDERIKNHFRAVAELRKSLSTIPSIDTSATTREVSVDELLSYARFISPTTVPPTFRKQEVALRPAIRDEQSDTKISNGIATPPTGAQEGEERGHNQAENIGTKSMTELEKELLDPGTKNAFTPWPDHLTIANGALGNIQRMVEQGKDPASVLSGEEQVEADKRRKEEEERERLEEEARRRRRESMFDTGTRRRVREEVDDVFDPDA
jgi:hypothetical protein